MPPPRTTTYPPPNNNNINNNHIDDDSDDDDNKDEPQEQNDYYYDDDDDDDDDQDENDDDDDNYDDQQEEWSVASAIRSAAHGGLFVHVRLGPYVCAEYNTGGIPEWLPLVYPNMTLRLYDDAHWKQVMRHYLHTMVTYLRSNQLWAHV
jgi:hypothetical protein